MGAPRRRVDDVDGGPCVGGWVVGPCGGRFLFTMEGYRGMLRCGEKKAHEEREHGGCVLGIKAKK